MHIEIGGAFANKSVINFHHQEVGPPTNAIRAKIILTLQRCFPTAPQWLIISSGIHYRSCLLLFREAIIWTSHITMKRLTTNEQVFGVLQIPTWRDSNIIALEISSHHVYDLSCIYVITDWIPFWQFPSNNTLHAF